MPVCKSPDFRKIDDLDEKKCKLMKNVNRTKNKDANKLKTKHKVLVRKIRYKHARF